MLAVVCVQPIAVAGPWGVLSEPMGKGDVPAATAASEAQRRAADGSQPGPRERAEAHGSHGTVRIVWG